jgi:hypothetical protein
MSDIFESTAKKYRGSPAVVILFVLALAMFLIGINHFIEDTVSSKLGLETLQSSYDLNVQIFQWSYWTMSLAPQIATMVFFYMYLSDTTKWSFLVLSGASQLMDFFADTWYRSNGQFFQNIEVFSISALLTFIYFTIGSEFFVTVGGGLLLKLAAPALQSWNIAIENIKKAQSMSYSPDKGEDRNRGEQRPQQNHQSHQQGQGHQQGKGQHNNQQGQQKKGGDERRQYQQLPNQERRTSDAFSKISQSHPITRPISGNSGQIHQNQGSDETNKNNGKH